MKLFFLCVILISGLKATGRTPNIRLPDALSHITSKGHNLHGRLIRQGVALNDLTKAIGAHALLMAFTNGETSLSKLDDTSHFIEETVFWTLRNGGEERHLFFKKGYTPDDQIESELSRLLSYSGANKSMSVKAIVRWSSLHSGRIKFQQKDWDENHVYKAIVNYAKTSDKYAVNFKTSIELTRISYRR